MGVFILGGQAINNEILTILGINQTIFLVMIISGCFLMVTAAVGVTAAYSKNQCLAFIVSIVTMINTVWIHGNEHNAHICGIGYWCSHNQK